MQPVKVRRSGQTGRGRDLRAARNDAAAGAPTQWRDACLGEDESHSLLAAPDRAAWTGRRLTVALETWLRASEITGPTTADVHRFVTDCLRRRSMPEANGIAISDACIGPRVTSL
jgi:hypothetical protein